MKITKNTKLEKIIEKLVEVSFYKGRLNQEKVKDVVNVLKGLSKGNAIAALSLYLKRLKANLDQNRLIIETSDNLSKHQIDEVIKAVSKLKPVFETEVIVNPKLLGGFKIQIGDDVYEDSILDRVSQVRKVIYE